MLGELGGDRHLDLFQRALWADGPSYVVRRDDEGSYSNFNPIGEEGTLALARVGTPEALTSLIQAYLWLPHDDPQFAAGQYLGTIVARLDGVNEPFDIMPWTGWRQERFGALP